MHTGIDAAVEIAQNDKVIGLPLLFMAELLNRHNLLFLHSRRIPRQMHIGHGKPYTVHTKQYIQAAASPITFLCMEKGAACNGIFAQNSQTFLLVRIFSIFGIRIPGKLCQKLLIKSGRYFLQGNEVRIHTQDFLYDQLTPVPHAFLFIPYIIGCDSHFFLPVSFHSIYSRLKTSAS